MFHPAEQKVRGQEPLSIQLLGEFRVTLGERTLLDDRVRQRRAATLIKLLALAPKFRLHREQLMDVLWPDLDPKSAANNLNYTVHTARRLLGDADGGSAPFLRREGDLLLLGTSDQIWVDACAFQEAATTAARRADPVAVEQAISLYTGDLLPEDRYEEWAIEQSARLRDHYLDLLRALAQYSTDHQDYQRAIDALQRILEREPADEDVHVQLMRLYALTDQRTRALFQYQRLKTALQREVETEPDPTTVELYQAIAKRHYPPAQPSVTSGFPASPEPVPNRPSESRRRLKQAPLAVGRSREQAILRERLTDAIAGAGSVVLISGEAGIGKTTLVRTLAREAAEENVLVLFGHCYDLTATPPYGPWSELARRYPADSDLPPFPRALLDIDALHALHSQAALFEELLAFLSSVAARRPVLLILEDLHWTDPVSVDLIRFVARHLDALPILMLVTYRVDEITCDHPLHQLEPVLVREADAERIRLRRLDTGALRELIRQWFPMQPGHEEQLLGYLDSRTTGNPLFVGEVLRSLVDSAILRQEHEEWVFGDPGSAPVPSLIGQVIERRLLRIEPESRHLLSVAAVLGQEVSLDVWAQVAGVPEEVLLGAVGQAAEVYLLEETPDRQRMRFVHALVREAVYNSIVLPRRLEWHRRAGDVLAGMPGSDPDTVASHFQKAADPRAVDWLIRAGDRAERAFDWRTATDRFIAASNWLKEDGTRALDRGWLLYRAAQIRMYFDPSKGVGELNEAMRVATAIRDPILHAMSLFRRGHLLGFTGSMRDGLDQMIEGLRELESLAEHDDNLPDYGRVLSPDVLARLNSGNLVLWLAAAGRYREAIDYGAGQLMSETPAHLLESPQFSLGWIDLYDWLNAYHGLGEAYAMMGLISEARVKLDAARQGFHEADVPLMVSNIILSIILHLVLPFQTDHVRDRRRLASEMEGSWNRASNAMPPVTVGGVQGLQLLILEGNWREAREIAGRGRAWQTNVARHPYLMEALGVVARAQGDTSLAWRQVRDVFPEGPQSLPGDSYFLPSLGLIQLAVELSIDQADLEQARRWLDTHHRWVAWSQALRGQAENALLEARFHRAAGNTSLARGYAEESLRKASNPRQPLMLLAAHRFLGEIETSERNFAEAEQHLLESRSIAEDCEAPFERARTLLAIAELRAAKKDTRDALSILDDVRSICEPIGAQPTIERVEELAARLIPRTGITPKLNALTAREIDVLRLLTQGMSDRDIAAALFISHHTAAKHVSHILDKLDVDSRTAAAAFAIRNDLV